MVIVSLIKLVVESVKTVAVNSGTAAFPGSDAEMVKVVVALVFGSIDPPLAHATGVPAPVFAQVIPFGGAVPPVTAKVAGAIPCPAVSVYVGEVFAGAPYVRPCTPSVFGGTRFVVYVLSAGCTVIVSLLSVVVVSVTTVAGNAGTARFPGSEAEMLNVLVTLAAGSAVIPLVHTTGVPAPKFEQVMPGGGEVPPVTANVTGAIPVPAVSVNVGEVFGANPYVRPCAASSGPFGTAFGRFSE
jgi:hypothetical protein